MYRNITKEYIRTHQFSCDGVHFEDAKEDADYRFAPGTVLPMGQEAKTNQLRKKLQEIVHTRYDGNYAKIDALCFINKDSFYKFFSKKRSFTRPMLAKLCVGINLPVEETKELFILQGHALDPENNLLDAIVVNCIQCKEDISVFFEMCEEHGVDMK